MTVTNAAPTGATGPPSLIGLADTNERHFATGHLDADLKGRSVRGGTLMLAAQCVKFGLQMGSTMVLARLLTPEDFGLVAMVTAVTGFVAMFKDAGLSVATIQSDNITHDQVSTLFWLNVTLSIFLMLLTASVAPLISWFYDEPRLLLITVFTATTFVFGGLTVQHQALLRRAMRFKDLAIIDIVAMTCGVTAATILAWETQSYWALVAMPASIAVVNAIGVWSASRWIPGRPRRGTGVMPMLKFGGSLSIASFLTYTAQNIDYVVLGWMSGANSVGLYRKSYELMMLPVRQINGPLASVMLPALSRLQDDPVAFRRAYLRILQYLALAGMPISAFLVVDASEVTRLLLGPGWEGTAGLIKLLAPAAFLATLYSAPGYIFLALGQGRRQIFASAIDTVIIAITIPIGAYWGPTGVAVAISVATTLSLPIRTMYACRQAPITFRQVVSAVHPILVASVVSALCVWKLKWERSGFSEVWLIIDLFVLLSITLLILTFSASGRSLLTATRHTIRFKKKHAGQ